MKKEEYLAVYATLVVDEFDKISPEEKRAAILAEIKRRGINAVSFLPLVREDAHKCPLCSSTFKWPSHLVKHLKLSHGAQGKEHAQEDAQSQQQQEGQNGQGQQEGLTAEAVAAAPATPAFTRSQNYGENFSAFVYHLVESLYEHAHAAYLKKPNEIVEKAGRFYTVNVHQLCTVNNCDSKYGLFCCGFLRHYSRDLIRYIDVREKNVNAVTIRLVLNTQFVTGNPNYYQKALRALTTELEDNEWPWIGDDKPSGFKAVLNYIAKLPRRSDKNKKSETVSQSVPDPDPDDEYQRLPAMTPSAKLNYINSQKQKAMRQAGPGPASMPNEKMK
jgi:hypothetical protein